MSNYTFDQLFDVTEVRQLLGLHHSLTGMAYSVFDTAGNNLLTVGWQDICRRFHRAHPRSCARCRERDTYLASHLLGLERDFIEYSCRNGMTKVAMPIVIEGEHVATFCSGQFFFDTADPDRQYFLHQAEELGFDIVEYFEALERVPVFSREYLFGNMFFLHNMMSVLAQGGLNTCKLTRTVEEGKRAEELLQTNITECKRMDAIQRARENALLKDQKLESLSIMAGGIAHDLSNILIGIIGHISLSQRNFESPSKAQKFLEIARMESLRATELTRRLTTLAKGDILIKKHVSLRDLIHESVSLTLDNGGRIRGEVLIPDGLDDIEVDEGQISRVFNNIVVNAVQSMPGGGTLTVLAGNVGEDECRTLRMPPGAYVKISFTDEGCGISEEDQKKIFEPFFTTKASGTGLGLASCHSIVIKHGGWIVVSSVVGSGTTFTIYLPSLRNSSRQDDLNSNK